MYVRWKTSLHAPKQNKIILNHFRIFRQTFSGSLTSIIEFVEQLLSVFSYARKICNSQAMNIRLLVKQEVTYTLILPSVMR